MNLRVPIFLPIFLLFRFNRCLRSKDGGETRQRLWDARVAPRGSSCNHDDCSHFACDEVERVVEPLAARWPMSGRIPASAYYRRSVVYDWCGWMDELWSAKTDDRL